MLVLRSTLDFWSYVNKEEYTVRPVYNLHILAVTYTQFIGLVKEECLIILG